MHLSYMQYIVNICVCTYVAVVIYVLVYVHVYVVCSYLRVGLGVVEVHVPN